MHWFETELLTREENLLGLMAVNREVVAQADDGADRVELDMDSSESPVHNEVRLQLSVLAHNLGYLWRRLVLPTRVETWSLTSLQQRPSSRPACAS